MAAALGLRGESGAEAEGWRRLIRAVTRLQARARGFLLRRELRAVRQQFEAVVLQLEGELGHLRWSGHVLQRPRFPPEDCPDSTAGALPGFLPPGEAQPRGSARPVQPMPGKPLDPGKAAENKKTIPKKSLEKPNPPGAEQAGGCANTPPSAPNPPNLGSGAAKSPEKAGRALAGSQEWDKESVTSEWDSTDLGAQPEIPQELQGLPRSELQSYRNNLLMELLWIQQAIASRKNFLMLKRKLGIPDHSGIIPEFLDWCGEALEMQHQS